MSAGTSWESLQRMHHWSMAVGPDGLTDYQRKMNSQEKCNNFMRQFRDDESRELKKLTANQFMEVWSHYDADGNGYIEGSELDGFLKEFVSSVNANDSGPEGGVASHRRMSVSDAMLVELKECFMEAYDDNQDGKIEIRELAQLLPMEENFLLLFRFDNPLESSVEFMKIWKAYDKDNSGYIEADELKNFSTRSANKEAKESPDDSEDKLVEYTDSLSRLTPQFLTFAYKSLPNKDGKLQLSEMAKLLPVKENFLCRSVFKGASKLTKEDIERVFALYDRDNNGTIENEELNGFLKDLLELVKKDYDALDLQEFQDAIMRGCDFNKDGKINKKELTMILLALAKHGADDDMQSGMGMAANNPLAEIATMGMKALKLQKLRVRHFVNRTLGTNTTS
nr:calbindin-32-like [Cherax quadricarinatus]